jgi:DNA-binding transcriptional regulator GbsR (MarR family)
LSLLDNKFLTFSEIVEKAKKSQSTVSSFLVKLVNENIVGIKIVELKKIYFLRNADMVNEIIEKYNPVLLERTAYNLADTFSNL